MRHWLGEPTLENATMFKGWSEAVFDPDVSEKLTVHSAAIQSAPCRSWVKSCYGAVKSRCLLCPRKRTLTGDSWMSGGRGQRRGTPSASSCHRSGGAN